MKAHHLVNHDQGPVPLLFLILQDILFLSWTVFRNRRESKFEFGCMNPRNEDNLLQTTVESCFKENHNLILLRSSDQSSYCMQYNKKRIQIELGVAIPLMTRCNPSNITHYGCILCINSWYYMQKHFHFHVQIGKQKVKGVNIDNVLFQSHKNMTACL